MVALIIILILIGLILLLAELFIIPGIGITGVVGVGSMFGACWLAFTSYGYAGGLIAVAISLSLIVIITLILLRTNTWKKLALKTNIESKVDLSPHKKGIEEGMEGRTVTRLAPAGQVRLGDHIVEVFSRDALIEPGKEIRVCEIEGSKIFVSEIRK